MIEAIQQLVRWAQAVGTTVRIVGASRDFGNELVGAVGWELDRVTGVPTTEVVNRLAALASGLDSLERWITSPPTNVATALEALAAVQALVDQVFALTEGFDFSSAPPEFGRFVVDLLEVMLAVALRAKPAAFQAAVLLGLVTRDREAGLQPSIVDATGTVMRRPRIVDRVRLDRLPALVEAPLVTLREEYLGEDSLETEAGARAVASRLLPRLAEFLAWCGLETSYGLKSRYGYDFGPATADLRHMMAVTHRLDGVPATLGAVLAIVSGSRGGPGLLIRPWGAGELASAIGAWTLTTRITGSLEALLITAGGLQTRGAGAAAEVELRLTRPAAQEPNGTFDPGAVSVAARVALAANTRDVAIRAELRGARLALGSSTHGDGLLARVAPSGAASSMFDAVLEWTLGGGLRFCGSGDLAARIPVGGASHIIALDAVRIGVRTVSGVVSLEVGGDVRLMVGPVELSAENVGLALHVDPSAPGGSLGLADLSFGPRWPDGVGVQIDAGVVSGGGRIQVESGPAADRRYLGMLALALRGVTVDAVAVLDATGPGYSLVATIGASFPAVPLPLGFTLDGVGGLIAIHRRVDTDALRASLRTPAGMGDIFFPADPVAQAERVTTDLATYFPAAEGRHVFGPAVKFGWGTPTMIRGELAVLLELPAPARVVLLGTVSAKLPTVDQAIVDLNVDVVGEVDFAQKRVAIDASLRNSTIAGFPITGDMAFRMAWGSPPSFALAIGGFHSHFPTPPGFPELRRVQIPLGAGDAPRLDAQGFLALTSNTAQIGAQIDLYASAGPLNIKGWLGFETLLTFSPFQLQVDVWAGVALRRGTSTLASIHFDGHLSGPKPWRLDGKACLSLWFVDLCVPIHVSFGAGTAAVLPSRQIWPALHEALATPAAWASTVPPGLAAAVTAPASGEAPTSRLEPCATLTVTQKVVPLDRQITAFAHGRPDGVDRFQVTGVRFGAAAVPAQEIAPVTEWFAPAQFEEMSEADKLSRPGFEQMVGGVSIGAATIRAGAPLVRALDYDTVVIVDGQRQEPPRYRPTRDLQLEGTLAAASARPPLRATGPAAFAPPPGRPPRLRLVEETFVIASTDALAPRWDLAAAGTRGQVELALRAHLAAHPGDAGRLQVVPTFEVAA